MVDPHARRSWSTARSRPSIHRSACSAAPYPPRSRAAEQAAARPDWDRQPVRESDPPAVEQQRRRARVLAAALHAAAAAGPPVPADPFAKLNVSAPSRKKSRFSGNSTLNRVRFTSCWSSSTCAKSVLTVKSATSVCRMPHFTSNPDVAVGLVGMTGGFATCVGQHRTERVRLDVDVLALSAGTSRPVNVAATDIFDMAGRPHEASTGVEVRDLVLVDDPPAEIHAPDVAAFSRKRNERNGNRISSVHPCSNVAGLHVPHAVPVVVRPLVGDRPVEHPAERIHGKPVAVAPIVEAVERHAEVIVVVEVVRVAPHFGGDALVRRSGSHSRADT